MVKDRDVLAYQQSTGKQGADTKNEVNTVGQTSLVQRLRVLHHLLTDPHESLAIHCEAYLKAGRHMFSADEAFLLKLRFLQDDAVVEAYSGTAFKTLEAVSQDEVWCSQVIEQKSTVFHSNSCVNSDPLTYTDVVIRGYLCSPVFVMGQLYGVLCFLQSTTESIDYTNEDIETIELMAKGVAKMIELQRVQPVDQSKLRAGFATEGVKTFEEYVEQARLPEVYGVPGRVVEVLQKRIGKCSLSIDHIAEEMNLSKRTLQRRLQQQGISFAQLRDQVRFHHSINYLVEQTMSIDSISASLDFSDRTSFTNAFKRWTGLSPSTFRKLFRDYA